MCSRTACAIDEDHLIAAIRNGHTDIILLAPLSCSLYIKQELCHIKTILHKMLKRLQKANKIIVYFISMASYKHLTLSFFNIPMTTIHIKTAPKMRPFITPLTVALFSSSTRARQTKVQEVVDKLKSGETTKGYATGVLSSYFCHLIYYTCTYTVM